MLKINTLPVGYKIGLAVVSRNLGADLRSMTNSLEKLSDKLDLKAVEVAIDAHNPVLEQIGQIELDIASLESKVGSTRLFLEIPACGAWDKILPVLLDAAVESASRSGRKIGFKLRCGGESHLIPSSKRVAKVLRECAARNLPIKFTAGLHQPLQSACCRFFH